MATPSETTPSEDLAVLVVDEEPDILAFFAKILDANGIRALLARTPSEAIGIAKRGYVPVDIVVPDIALRPDINRKSGQTSSHPVEDSFTSGRDLVDELRNLRPGVRALYMSAYVDSGVIRIELMDRDFKTNSKNPDDRGLIASIRHAASAPMVYRAGSFSGN